MLSPYPFTFFSLYARQHNATTALPVEGITNDALAIRSVARRPFGRPSLGALIIRARGEKFKGADGTTGSARVFP